MRYPNQLILEKPAMVADVHVKCEITIRELWAEKRAAEQKALRLERILRKVYGHLRAKHETLCLEIESELYELTRR